MQIDQFLKAHTATAIQELYGQQPAEQQLQFQPTRKEFTGDITLNVFPLLKISRQKPEETAQQIGEALLRLEEVHAYEIIKGFLNIQIGNRFWLNQLSAAFSNEEYGTEKTDRGLVMVEFSSPNTNKPLHLGHLRNIFLGDSVSRILDKSGNQVVRTQIINDRGIHICKSMVAWLKFGKGETPETSGMKGDHLAGKYYVAFDKHYKKEMATLISEKLKESELLKNDEDISQLEKDLLRKGKSKDQELTDLEKQQIQEIKGIISFAEKEAPILKEAQSMLLKWESKDPETIALWQKMNTWVYDGFSSTYTKMSVDFDVLYYESDTYLLGKQVVQEGLDKGVFFKKEDGSVWIDLSDDGLDEKLILRADGTAVYMTQDIGTAIERYKNYPDVKQMIYTVGNEQNYHFKVLFLILDKLGYAWAKSCYHLSYGMVELPEGKMKSREGTVVDADDLMQEVIDAAAHETNERGGFEGLSEEEKSQLSEMLGLGALKYYLLKVDPKKSMQFNPKESVDLTGNTAPFIQYTHARIKALLRKAEQDKLHVGVDSSVELQAKEKDVVKAVLAFPQIVNDAAGAYTPAMVANYTYDLVKTYNSFYQSVPIFRAENEKDISFRLALSNITARVVKSAFEMLGIQVPERM